MVNGTFVGALDIARRIGRGHGGIAGGAIRQSAESASRARCHQRLQDAVSTSPVSGMVTVMVSPGVPLPESVGVVSLVTAIAYGAAVAGRAEFAQPVRTGRWHRWSAAHSWGHSTLPAGSVAVTVALPVVPSGRAWSRRHAPGAISGYRSRENFSGFRHGHGDGVTGSATARERWRSVVGHAIASRAAVAGCGQLAQPEPPGHWHRWSTEHSSVH
jgi:hypothetical protein